MKWLCHAFALLGLSLGLSACALLQRSPSSGYADLDQFSSSRATDFYQERRDYEEQLAKEDLGWAESRQLSEGERAQLESHLRLRRLESKLESEREKRQYFHLKGSMKNDYERLAFLSLPSVEARERWARNRGLASIDDKIPEEYTDIIEKNDLVLGMNQKSVTASWGDPDAVEVAGNPAYGNERWRYSRYVSASDGYQKETRIVYFEAGRVVGWESY